MRTSYVCPFIVFCLFLITTQVQAIGPKEIKEKTIRLSYPVKINTLLDLDNKYGNVLINNHTGNTVEVEVTIKAWDGTAKKAQKTLDRIGIKKEQSAHKISLKTHIEQDDHKDIVLNASKGFSINYVIKMPQQMRLELENKFGNVQLDNVLGEVDLEVKHGNLKTGKLGEGEIEVKFGNVEIDAFQKAASVKVKHGNLLIGQANQLEVDQSYGNCQIGTVRYLEGEVKHGNTTIKSVAQKLDWENEFGNFTLKKIETAFDKLKLEVKHGNAAIDFDSASKFTLAARTQHGNINHKLSNVTINQEQFEYIAQGRINGGGNASVEVAVEFGNIKLR